MENLIEFIGQQLFLSTAFVVVLVLLIRAELMNQAGRTISLSPNEAIRKINNDGAIVVAVDEPEEFDKSHISNAINVPLAQVLISTEALDDHRDKPIVTYCKHGNTSIRACKLLKRAGFEDVYSIQGGLNAWQEAQLPIKSTN